MDVKASKNKYIGRLVDWKNFILLEEITLKKPRSKTKKVADRTKQSKTPVEVKQV